MRRTSQFHLLLSRPGPLVLAGAHNGLSARLVEEARFDAVWASGFEISAAHAVPDANILTMAENLAVIKNIADSVAIPVIADGDTGYGNAINVMRMVEEYEKAGVAGVCIEDNVFPKRCSFYAGVKRELERIEEFCGKIRAGKRAQTDPDFVIIARTEALIAGWGLDEALRRARAYAQAGADLILVHSKSSRPDEVMAFARAWDGDRPLVAVPTTYHTASVEELYAAGFKVVIFANQGIRAAIKSMREVFARLRGEHRGSAVEDRIAPLAEVYRLIGVEQLRASEAEYLPAEDRPVTAVIVAAGKGFEQELMPLIADRPKAMLDVRGKTILERQIEALGACGIRRIVIVRGYQKEKIALPGIRYYDNDRYEETNVLTSFFCAEEAFEGRVLLLYGDILFDTAIVEKLLRSPADITIVVDHAWSENRLQGIEHPSRPERVKTLRRPVSVSRFLPSDAWNTVVKIGRALDPSEANAEFIGMALFSERGVEQVKAIYHELQRRYSGRPFHEAATLEQASLSDFLQELIDRDMEVAALDIYKGWMEVDTFEDYRKMWAEIES